MLLKLAIAVATLMVLASGQGLSPEEQAIIDAKRKAALDEDLKKHDVLGIVTEKGNIVQRVRRDGDVLSRRAVVEEASTFKTKTRLDGIQKALAKEAETTFASLAADSIAAAVDTTIVQVQPHLARVDDLVAGVAKTKSELKTIEKSVAESIAAAKKEMNDEVKKVTDSLATAKADTNKALADSEKKVTATITAAQKTLKAEVDAGFSQADLKAGELKCEAKTAGRLRLHEKELQICDGEGWTSASGGGSAAFGTKAKPWGKTCKAILDAGKSKGDGVYWIQFDGQPGNIRVYCDMTTDKGGWTMLFKWRGTYQNSFHHFRGPMQNGFQEPLDPFQSPIQGPEDHHTDSHHDNECAVEGLSWLQRRTLWPNNKAGEYRWDSYRVDGGLHYAMKGTNTHSSNMLYMYVKGASHNEMGRGFSNSRISGSYTIIKKKHVNNMDVGSSYGVWSHGHYDCDCSESYTIRDHWGSGSAWTIWSDKTASSYGSNRGGNWDNPNHYNHAVAWMR